MTEKYQISFSKKYSKLQTPIGFSTVRWNDAVYRLGKVYDVVYIVPGPFHRRIVLGKARIIKMELSLLKNLTAEFMRQDADCSREEFYALMQSWYSAKSNWKYWDSEVEVLICQWIYNEPAKSVLNQEYGALNQKQLVQTDLEKSIVEGGLKL